MKQSLTTKDRQAKSKNSVERWRAYEPILQPLLKGFDEKTLLFSTRTTSEQAIASNESALSSIGMTPALTDSQHDFDQAMNAFRQGRFNRAQRLCRGILAKEPNSFNALHLLSVLHSRQGQYLEALHYLNEALKTEPGNLAALLDLGGLHARLGQATDALKYFNKVLAIQPDHAAALNNRGNILMQLGQAKEALASYDKALAIMPHLADTHYNRANALMDLKRLDEALASYDRALTFRSDYVEALNDRSNVLRELARPADAVASCDRALALRPGYADAWNNRGLALKDLHRDAEAMASYDRALALDPMHAAAFSSKATLLVELGQLDAAREAIEAAVRLNPDAPSFYVTLGECKRFAAGDPHLSKMVELSRDPLSLSGEERIQLHFASGKAYADISDHERSFQHYLEGNTLKRREIAYDENAAFGTLQRIQVAFNGERMRSERKHGDPSNVPIFILGMPRSGSTLIEQILASHPQVFGAGEIQTFGDVMVEICKQANVPPTPEGLLLLSGEQLHRIGRTYISNVCQLAPAAGRITNKTPNNFRLIGLIHLVLPNARIIHSRRDPIDNCVACFSKLFDKESWPYTYDLAEMGRYYRAYESMMAHWRDVLPPGVILDVQYEDVVEDLEGQTRRILDFCGLEWDPRCLDFHKTERPVRTASKAQVREPLFKTSVARWRKYEAFLGPLLEALGLPPPNERMEERS